MHIEFTDLKAQYNAYSTELQAAMQQSLASGQYILGPQVSELEKQLSNYLHVPHAITCASGTDALQLALMAIDIQPGDEVITSPFTFIAAAEIIALLKARPVFVDIDPMTFNIDATKIAEKITNKTKAIIPIALYGQPADMQEINEIAKIYSEKFNHKIYVIEDAAQSLGAEYQDKKSCNLSEISCTSFFPAKPLGCYGDGGAIFTTNSELAEKIKALRVHGQSKRYYHEYIGFNARFDTLQAAILLVKLKHFPDEVKKRQQIAAYYNQLFSHQADLQIPFVKPDRTSVYAQYTLRINNRDEIQAALQKAHIPTAIHYPIPLHLQPCFQYLGYKAGDFPQAEKAAQEVISLPMSAFVQREQQDYIAEHLINAL